VVARIRMARPPAHSDAPLETLRALLDSASRVLGELDDDPLLARLTRVYAELPTGDREPIVAILEREVQARLTADAAGDVTGLALRPNPGARIYTRILGGDPRPNPERAVRQALRAIQITHGAVPPWTASGRRSRGTRSPRRAPRSARAWSASRASCSA
jgi:hypothetical protein